MARLTVLMTDEHYDILNRWSNRLKSDCLTVSLDTLIEFAIESIYEPQEYHPIREQLIIRQWNRENGNMIGMPRPLNSPNLPPIPDSVSGAPNEVGDEANAKGKEEETKVFKCENCTNPCQIEVSYKPYLRLSDIHEPPTCFNGLDNRPTWEEVKD